MLSLLRTIVNSGCYAALRVQQMRVTLTTVEAAVLINVRQCDGFVCFHHAKCVQCSCCVTYITL